MDALISIAYHVAALELIFVSVMAWKYNGWVTSGTGRFIGSFTLSIAMILVRMDAYYIARDIFGHDLSDEWWWDTIELVQASTIAILGGNLSIYILRRYLRSIRGAEVRT